MTADGRRVVVVTGAAAGVGRATARAFGDRGDAVALVARENDGLDAAVGEVERGGGRAIAIPTDVADAAAVEAAADRAERELGPIDVWVNCAMATIFAFLWEIEPDEYRRATEVTYLGFVWGTQAALRRMRPRNAGTIVLVGSALAYRGIPLQSAYCGSKHAIQGFFESVRAELIHERSKVRVTMVQLPGLNTPQFGWVRNRLPKHARPVAPVFQPEVAADGIVWAAEHDRRELWIGGSTAMTIVGNALAPGLADRYLGRKVVQGQQVQDKPDPSDRPDYLFEPLPDDRGAHGIFDGEAKARSLQLELTKRRRPLLLAGGLAVAGALAGALRRSR
jgi:NAD(P)-dependent dehydrogenase (short-subunit alcohol dehydrogenase family)